MSTEHLREAETDFDEAVPFLVIELVPYENRPKYGTVRMVSRIQNYLSRGVDYVWVVDSREEIAMSFSQTDRRGTVCKTLRTENPTIEIPAFDLDA